MVGPLCAAWQEEIAPTKINYSDCDIKYLQKCALISLSIQCVAKFILTTTPRLWAKTQEIPHNVYITLSWWHKSHVSLHFFQRIWDVGCKTINNWESFQIFEHENPSISLLSKNLRCRLQDNQQLKEFSNFRTWKSSISQLVMKLLFWKLQQGEMHVRWFYLSFLGSDLSGV